MNSLFKNKMAIGLGVLFVAFMAWCYISKVAVVENLNRGINSAVYDLLLKANLNKLPPIKNNSIAVIAIDDLSISTEGRWPWGRKKISTLIAKLQEMGAAVIAFDILFSEPEENILNETLADLKKNSAQFPQNLQESMVKLAPMFDYDTKLGDFLKKGDNVLGFVLNPTASNSTGSLPLPVATLSKENIKHLKIPVMKSYMGNINLLQSAAKNGGFLNSLSDEDGTIRNASLILAHDDKVYASLALEATYLFLLSSRFELITEGNPSHLTGIQLDNQFIPTNESGEILVPYRGDAYTYPFFSATDILHDKVESSDISGKIIFIGATGTGLGDLKSTAVGNNYPGVEVHATIASAILDNYFPKQPSWSTSLELGLIITLGLIAAIIFPFLTAPWLALIAVSSVVIWVLVSFWLWVSYSLLLTLLFPLLTVFLLAFNNMVNSYIVSSNQRKQIKSVFGQYVPQTHVDSILKTSNETLLAGENKELSVLFSDICGFTTMSENMTAPELKAQLNDYLTCMTRVIFDLEGTIDKYVGDMIMAFWNAPIDEAQHAKKSVTAGLTMQSELKKLNKIFLSKNRPEVKIGVGINTGLINVGDMGSEYRRAYTAIGDAVNLASRLEGMTRKYFVDIIVGENTYEQTKDEFIYMYLDKVKVKGKDTAVKIYSPLDFIENNTKELSEELEKHHKALELYFNQDWLEAEPLFKELIAHYPQRLTYPIYISRINFFKENPPGSNWDGSFAHDSK